MIHSGPPCAFPTYVVSYYIRKVRRPTTTCKFNVVDIKFVRRELGRNILFRTGMLPNLLGVLAESLQWDVEGTCSGHASRVATVISGISQHTHAQKSLLRVYRFSAIFSTPFLARSPFSLVMRAIFSLSNYFFFCFHSFSTSSVFYRV